MINILLYTTVVLIWGSSWIMIPYQVGVVPVQASVAYRLIIAAVLLFGWTAIRRLPLRFSFRNHLFIALQGALIFSTNFFLLYMATDYLATGLISVVFSTASALTMLFNALKLKRMPTLRMLVGVILGFCGMMIIFWPEVAGFSLGTGAGFGLLLSLGGTICFSLGSIVTARNQAAGLSMYGSTAWGMLYGVVLLSVFLTISGNHFSFDPAWPYMASLLYLAVVGSVVGFASYFTLLRRIEAERAAYATVLFPVVALSLSTLFEGYQWTATVFIGVVLTLLGNVFVLMKPEKFEKRILKKTQQINPVP